MKFNFKDWTKENWDALDDKTWNKILTYCVPRGVWIEESNNQSEVLIKLVLAPTYDIDLEHWDMDRINKVAKTYGRVSRGIHHRLQHLRGEELEEIQQFQDTGYQPIWISNPAPPTSKMTAMDVGRLNMQNRRNDNQQAPIPISNQVSNSFTFEIRKDCESISECSTALALPAQILPTQAPLSEALPMQAITIEANPIQVPSMQVPLTSAPLIGAPAAPPAPILAALMQAPPEQVPAYVQVPLEQVPLVHAPLTEVLSVPAPSVPAPSVPIKDVSKVFIPEEFVASDKVVTPEKILSDAQKGHPVVQAYNDKDKNLMLTQLPTKLLHGVSEVGNHRFANHHLHYKEKLGMTESTYKTSLLRPPPQLISPPAASANYIVKVMKPLYDMPEASITRFAIYHPHYKDKFSNPTRTFVCAANYLYFICSLDNILTPPTCTTEPGLVMKKREPLRTSLHLLSHQPQSLLLSSTLLEIRLVIFEYLAMLQYAPAMSEWQFVCDGGACVTQPGLVAKKEEPPRFVLHLLSRHLSLPSFFLLSLTLLKMRLVIFK